MSDLVVRAMTPDGGWQSRSRAFEELVGRFQDMAFACAYGRLGDRGLAEDAAQEAFVSAWLNLDQLRSPAAFPGWFRQIVLRQCTHVAAQRGPAAAPLSETDERSIETHDAASTADQLDLRDDLRGWIEGLPEHERTPVLLFYMSGRAA